MSGAPDAADRPARRRTVTVDVGGVPIGSAHPIVVQSMTNTDTADPDATVMRFLQSTYDAVADLAGWDRATLEVTEGFPRGT